MLQISWLIVALLLAGVATAQSDFSAEIVTQKSDTNPPKIYLSKDKMRIESTKKDPRNSGIVIMNLRTETAIVLMDQQHAYMELPVQMASQRNAYNFFRAGDIENACSSWLISGKNKGGSCHKVSNDTVNGRPAVKYEGTSASGEATTFWIDSKIAFPVKWEDKKSSGELRNIQEGALPASLFEVPAGYTKFDMGSMMQQRPQ